ncbi:MAG: hypothetical protein ACOCXQ_02550 [Patescibacteria group bacterium]
MLKNKLKSIAVFVFSFILLFGVFYLISSLDVAAQANRPNQTVPSISVTVKVDQSALGFRIPDLSDVLTFIIRGFFVIAGLVALLYLLLGAFTWITSGGEEEGTKKARDKITAAIVGVILIVVVLAVIVTLEQVVFAERICFGVSCAASIPNLVEPCGPDVGIACDPDEGNPPVTR